MGIRCYFASCLFQQEVGRECGLLSALLHVVSRVASISIIGVPTQNCTHVAAQQLKARIPNADLSSNKQNIYRWITKH